MVCEIKFGAQMLTVYSPLNIKVILHSHKKVKLS